MNDTTQSKVRGGMRSVNVALVRLCFCASARMPAETVDPDGLATEPGERLRQPADAAAEIERGPGDEGAEKCPDAIV